MKINQLRKDEIVIIDPLGGTGNKCNCGKEAKFILRIHGHYINLCEVCTGEVGKVVIDGLV